MREYRSNGLAFLIIHDGIIVKPEDVSNRFDRKTCCPGRLQFFTERYNSDYNRIFTYVQILLILIFKHNILLQ